MRAKTVRPNLAFLSLVASALWLASCQQNTSSPVQPSDLAKTGATTSTPAGVPTPISGPTVITQSGEYVVDADFSVPPAVGDGIVIEASFVRLDLDGHTITGPGNKLGRGIVVSGANHVVVENGTLATFGIGVALLESNGCVTRDLRVAGGDEMADPPTNPPQIGFLLVNSFRNRIRHNRADLVNLGIFVRGGGSYENLITRNVAIGGDNGLLAICYNPADGEGEAGPSRDGVFENQLSRFGTGIAASAGSAYNRFNSNVIEYFDAPWSDMNGTNEFLNNQTMQITP